MRNLELLDSLRIGDAVELAGTQYTSVDYDTKEVYCVTHAAVYVINPESQDVNLGLLFSEYLSESKECSVVGVQHLPDQMSVCIAFLSGDILLWNVTTKECECVGSVESGILSMGWSPDHEVIVIVTGKNTLIIMTRDFDPVTEIPIEESGFGEAEFVTVGWGKKETQFHGSIGKEAALVKSEAVKPVFAWDDRKPRVSWRGDGQFFVVSFISSNTSGRVLRTWTREGVLHSTSESVDGVEQAVAWKPSGSLIATSQRKPNRHDVIFFERNGLKHGEFTLPFKMKQVLVKEMIWNTDSTVLLVWCEEMLLDGVKQEKSPKSWLQLWTVNNYHWYLKQSLDFPATNADRVAAISWDPEHAYVLHIVCAGGQYLQYHWFWNTCGSEDDTTQVAVIDGDQVLITAFETTVIPPPMAAYSIKLERPAQNVLFSNGNIFVGLGHGSLIYYTYSEGSKPDPSIKMGACGGSGFATKCKTANLCANIRLEVPDLAEYSYPLQMYHFQSVSSNQFIFCTLTMMGNTSVIHKCSFVETDNVETLVIEDSLDIEGRVLAIAHHNENGNIAIQLTNGLLFKLCLESMTIKEWRNNLGEIINFSQPCPQMALFSLGGEEVVIGMTERFRLFINNIQVATNCTSFAIHKEFLLLTTHSHTCRCICRKTKLSMVANLSDGKAHPFDESVRRIERGSRIVSVVQQETKLVLQMPRGNLETINPRALVLASVKNHLNKLEFQTAFILMRKHRINMNLLYDHDPELFLNNVEKFISQINNPTHLNLFISELQEEDVTQTMYTATYQGNNELQPTLTESKKTSKIDRVCDALKVKLIEADYNRYLLSILTAYVRKTTPELDQALHCIKNLKGRDNNQGQARAEEALKHLLFLVDVNELYDVALGTYDFDLVLMVAEKSQKDPKEYLPFLNNLRRLEENFQKYSIDKYLKKYRDALKHIVLCGKDHFEECLGLITEHRLYPEALELYQPNYDEYQTVAIAYADYLSEKKYYEEAGIMFVKGKNLNRAQEEFEKCLDWRNCMTISTRLGYSAEKLGELGRSLANRLKDVRRHSEASILVEQYAQDAEEAIVTLIQGHLWDEALRTMYKYGREDFIETDLKPGLQDAFEQHQQSFQEQRELFERRCNRLAVVRDKKEKRKLELIEGGGDYNRADADLFSDTSSATGDSIMSDDAKSRGGQSRKSGSIYTKVSGTSRKARRKAEGKKKWSLKEGSNFEDFAIIESLAQIVKHVDSLKDDLSALLKIMVQFNLEKQARQLQLEYEGLVSLIERTIPEIWDPMQQQTSYLPASFGPDSTANTIALAMQQGIRPTTTQEQQLDPVLCVAPVIKKDSSWKLNILSRTTDTFK